MSLKITDKCINCGACVPTCPNTAIYSPAEKWRMSEGNDLEGRGEITLDSGKKIQVDDDQEAKSEDYYYIAEEKCTQCVGHFDEPQCVVICPIADDALVQETEPDDLLLARKNLMHLE